MNVLEGLEIWKNQTNQRLKHLLPPINDSPIELHQAMSYSCLAEGKRIRPLFCCSAAQAIGELTPELIDVGCAIEMIHCFSLIHDDLPCIDNDDLRRGKPTCHKIYGEAIAVLAGDALMVLAIEVLSSLKIDPIKITQLIKTLTQAIGSGGLVGGEVLDILSEKKTPTLEILETIHKKKTASLIAASMVMGGILMDASQEQIQKLNFYGTSVGLAFQIIDDILDEVGSSEQIGKPSGSDKEKSKMTYPLLMGIGPSKLKAKQLIQQACLAIQDLPNDISYLNHLAHLSLERFH